MEDNGKRSLFYLRTEYGRTAKNCTVNPLFSHIMYLTILVMSMKLVTVLLPEAYLEGLDELVRANMYPSRSSAIRSAVRDLLKKELWPREERP